MLLLFCMMLSVKAIILYNELYMVYGGLLVLMLTSYWLTQQAPLLIVLIYPLASIALALLAESIEEMFRKKIYEHQTS